MDFLYALLMMGVIFNSLHFKNGDKFFKPLIYIVSSLFGLFMLIIMGVLFVDIVRGLMTNSTRNFSFIFRSYNKFK